VRGAGFEPATNTFALAMQSSGSAESPVCCGQFSTVTGSQVPFGRGMVPSLQRQTAVPSVFTHRFLFSWEQGFGSQGSLSGGREAQPVRTKRRRKVSVNLGFMAIRGDSLRCFGHLWLQRSPMTHDGRGAVRTAGLGAFIVFSALALSSRSHAQAEVPIEFQSMAVEQGEPRPFWCKRTRVAASKARSRTSGSVRVEYANGNPALDAKVLLCADWELDGRLVFSDECAGIESSGGGVFAFDVSKTEAARLLISKSGFQGTATTVAGANHCVLVILQHL
jgi:hypothetical protein